MKFILFLALFLFLQRALGDLICEELPVEMCTLSIDSSGKRCVLESTTSGEEGKFEMQCQTSEVFASNKRLQEYIETDECVGACGVDRQSLGLSSDSLLDSKFISKLCSHQCYNNCPNIVDLYSNLASAEGAGVSLPEMCSSQKTGLGRGTSKLLSSGAAAPGGYGGGQVSAAAPSQDAAAPSQNDAAPAAPVGYGGGQDAAAPQNAEAPPPQNAEAPSQNYAAPSQDAAAPSQNAEAPSQDAAAPPPSQY
ncbi:uncharacterized protein LOC132064306 isoform X2 [Lycium ferocissimum]|uniref:uncharacterized protein LOC132064306 isoform X2 n=1 Tax=Lycium ferocissimum TaxID=112874 RepID=UPI00281511B1|nr:uncharacterized protein LOC132064306 isoform X2 [Lycium ferocissimum]